MLGRNVQAVSEFYTHTARMPENVLCQTVILSSVYIILTPITWSLHYLTIHLNRADRSAEGFH